MGAFQIVARVANLYKVHLNLKVPLEGWQPFNPLRQFEMHPGQCEFIYLSCF
jgi:hypothetical protein